MTLETLQDLYVDELQDVYDAEHQLLDALEKLQKSASHKELKAGFKEHHQQTQEHVRRLEQVFKNLDKPAKRKTCKAMKGIVKEGQDMIEEDADKDVKDAGLIAAAQRAEHYEMAAYGTLVAYAKQLNRRDDAKLLNETLKEEKETDKKLTEMALSVINTDAAA